MKKASLLLLSLLMIFQMSMLTALSSPVKAAETSGEITEEYSSDENPDSDPLEGLDTTYLENIESENVWYDIDTLDWLTQNYDYIDIPASDQIALTDSRVDVRVTKYLLELVKPEKLGGFGLTGLRVSRLLKNYDSEGTGRFDRELAGSLDEDASFISTHNRGQAVDISAAGEITCKVVLKNKLGSRKTLWQKPRSVKVAWQSKDGINHNPTPRGPSLIEIAGNMASNQILTAMNESGEMDAWVDFTRGLNLETIISYVGASVLLKSIGLNNVGPDPLAERTLPELVGTAVLYKTFPDLPEGLSLQNNGENILIALSKAEIENRLGLPSGTLRGYGWDEIMENAGKRAIENALQLPSLSLDYMSLEEINRLPEVQGAYSLFQEADKALNFPVGTTEKLRAGDKQGIFLAGVNVLANSLRLTNDQRSMLEKAAQSVKFTAKANPTNEDIAIYANELSLKETGRGLKELPSDSAVYGEYIARAENDLRTGKVTSFQDPGINFEYLPIATSVPVDTMNDIVASDENRHKEARSYLVERGAEIINKLSQKAVPDNYDGVGQTLLSELARNSTTYLLGELKETLGEKKLASAGGLEDSQTKNWWKTASFRQKMATALNRDLGLSGQNQLSESDLNNGPESLLEFVKKIGARQAEAAFHWKEGLGLQVINGQVTIAQAFENTFANKLGEILGISNHQLSLRGDIYQDYGQAILESSFGLSPNSLDNKNNVSDLTPAELKNIFGIEEGQSLDALRANPEYWDDYNRRLNWERMDARLGVARGTVLNTLRGDGNLKKLARQAGNSGLTGIAVRKLWQQLGLDDSLKLTDAEGTTLITNLSKWDSLALEEKLTTIQLGLKAVGRQIDGMAGLPADTMINIINAPSGQERTQALIKTGVFVFMSLIGEDAEAEEIENVSQALIDLFNGGSMTDIVATFISPSFNPFINGGSMTDIVATFISSSLDIPPEFRQDALAIERGDIKTIIGAWTAKKLLKEINQYLPGSDQITYEQVRVAFTNPDLDEDEVQREAANLYFEREGGDFFQLAPNSSLADNYQQLASRRLIEARLEKVQYLTADAMLRRSGVAVPPGFTYAMMRGSDSDRARVLQEFVLFSLEKPLREIEPSLPQGILRDIWNNQVDKSVYEPMIVDILAKRAGVDLGPFSGPIAIDFFQIISHPNDPAVYKGNHANTWEAINSFLGQQLGIGQLPDNIAQSVFYASQNNWSVDARVLSGDQVIVPSLSDIGNDFFSMKVSAWADRELGLPQGSSYQLYSAYNQWRKGTLSTNGLYLVMAKVALDSCGACQKVFRSVDSALGAPAGFTNMTVQAGLTFWLMGPQAGWVALGIAVAYYFLGWSSSKYLCPIPPPDWYGTPGYDLAYDVLDYKWGDYYSDRTRPVESTPQPGQTAWDWIKQTEDEGRAVQFADGNDPDLWMAWSRYFTGRLIDKTMEYGIYRASPNKPKQISTFRQANVLNFAPLSVWAFGGYETGNPTMGLGFTQNTTKTTDWVHVAFGGLF